MNETWDSELFCANHGEHILSNISSVFSQRASGCGVCPLAAPCPPPPREREAWPREPCLPWTPLSLQSCTRAAKQSLQLLRAMDAVGDLTWGMGAGEAECRELASAAQSGVSGWQQRQVEGSKWKRAPAAGSDPGAHRVLKTRLGDPGRTSVPREQAGLSKVRQPCCPASDPRARGALRAAPQGTRRGGEGTSGEGDAQVKPSWGLTLLGQEQRSQALPLKPSPPRARATPLMWTCLLCVALGGFPTDSVGSWGLWSPWRSL